MLSGISLKASLIITTIDQMINQGLNTLNQPITYDINCFEDIIEDCTQRYNIFQHYYTTWEKKAKIDSAHADKLIQLSSNAFKIQHPSKPSEILYKSFINIIEQEAISRRNYVRQIEDEVMKKLRDQIIVADKDIKKYLTLGKSLKKDLQYDNENLQKTKQKFYKKNTQLEKMKLEYIMSTLLSDRDFQKKNKLFLKIKQIEHEISPLRKNYEVLSSKYSEQVSIFSMRLGQILTKLQSRQLRILQTMKETQINSQLFKSAMGAFIMNETQRSLSFFGNFDADLTEVQRHTHQQLEQQRRFLESNYNNPAEYIEQLFNKVQKNTIQEIIRYGQNFMYKTELSDYFDSSFESQGSSDDTEYKKYLEISDYTIRIIEIFKSVFEQKQECSMSHFCQSTLIEFKELIVSRPTLRKDFIMCLQKYRLKGKFQIHERNLNRIVNMIEVFLNICNKQFDTYNSKQLMVLSFTYYFINPETEEKIDLQQYIRNHSIWGNIKWWECSLLESIYEEHRMKVQTKKSQTSKASGSNCVSIWDIKGTSLRKIQSEEEDILVNICFNQLAYYVHNMQLFEIDSHLMNTYANKYIKLLGLTPKMASNIALMCGSVKQIP